MSELGKIIDPETGEVLVEMSGPPQAAGKEDLSGALYALSELLARGYEMDGMHGGLGGPFSWGVNFENDVFLMAPDYQDAKCNCGFSKRADEWHDAHKHKGFCYSVTIRRLERRWEHATAAGISEGLRRFPVIAKRICELRGIPWDNGWGSGVHCDCGIEQEVKAWFAANGHEFRCPIDLPNFWHKRTGLEVRWYKSIGRDMEIKPEHATAEIVSAALREAFESIPEEIRNKAQQDHDAEHTPEAEEEKSLDLGLMFEALERMKASQTPCWGCSEAGQLKPTNDGKMRGGSFCGGIGRTLHDEAGACLNCGHVNTPRQTARLAQHEEKKNEAMRLRFR